MTVTQATPKELGEQIADAGAVIGDERKGIVYAASRIIRAERKGTVSLSPAEVRAALNAISQMTHGNARDFDEWKLATHGTRHEWLALLRAEEKFESMLNRHLKRATKGTTP